MTPRHLVGVIATLRGGGAERVLAGIVNGAAEAGNRVTVVTLFPAYDDDYPLHREIERVSLGTSRSTTSAIAAARNNVRRIAMLRRAVADRHPTAVLSFMDTTNVVTLLATRGLGVPVIVSERVDPRYYRLRAPWPALRRLTYPFAQRVVVQTESVASGWAIPRFGRARVRVIPNPLVLDPAAPVEPMPGPYILAAGRLDPQKGFDELIKAYAQARASAALPPLVILGEGEEQGPLAALAATLGVGDAVRLPGRTTEIARWYKGAHAFALSSHFEGFPNVLLEALAFGIPSVATDCPSGPAELLADGAGLLVPLGRIDAMAAALTRACTDGPSRTTMSARGRLSAARFSSGETLRAWLTLLGLESGGPSPAPSRPTQ